MISIKKLWFLPIFAFPFCVGCSQSPPNNEITFANDSWANVINYANEGIDSLVNHYHPSGNTFIILPSDTKEDIKRKTRKVEIDGYGTFDARVIGECMNNINTVLDEKVATLTFEFTECVTCSEINPHEMCNYKESPIRNFLNNDLINKFPKELRNNIATVVNHSINDQGVMDTYNDKLFLPTLSEALGKKGGPSFGQEGEPYPFHFLNPQFKYSIRHLNNYAIPYWTRSLVWSDDFSQLLYGAVSKDGEFFDKKTATEILGISPLFAIGSNPQIKSLYLSAPNAVFKEPIRYPVDETSISNTVSINAFKFSDGSYLPATSIKKKQDVKAWTNNITSQQIDHFDRLTGKFTIENVPVLSRAIVFTINPLEIDVGLDKIVEIAEFDENNNYGGEFARKFVNIGDFYNLAKLPGCDELTIEVIGCGHDSYTVDGKTKQAAFTFDTKECSLSKHLTYDDQNDNSSYASSKVHRYLNSTETGSIFDIIKATDESFYQHLKTCNKPMYQAYGPYDANTWKIVNLPAKAWALSAIEVAVSPGFLKKTIFPFHEDNLRDGEPYDYYQILPYGPLLSYIKMPQQSPDAFKLRTPIVSGRERTNEYLTCGGAGDSIVYHFEPAISSPAIIVPSFAI